MEKERFFAVIRGVPKVELHLHLDDFIVEQEAYVDCLPSMLEEYRAAQLSRKGIEDFERVFNRLARYMVRNGVVYAEVYFAIVRYVANGFEYKEMVEFFEKCIKRIEKNDGIVIRMIACLSRSYGVESASNVLDLVLKHRNKYVIAVGLGGDESKGKGADFAELFAKARENGLRTHAHAGEFDNYQSVIDTVNILKPERIGHAVSAMQSEEAVKLLADSKIPVEILLSSNVLTKHYVTKPEDHPVKLFWSRGVFITLSTDDPNLFKTSLMNEYWLLHHNLGLSMNDIYCVIINGFRASFLPESNKRAYIRLVNKKWNRRFTLTERMKHKSWQDACQDVFDNVE